MSNAIINYLTIAATALAPLYLALPSSSLRIDVHSLSCNNVLETSVKIHMFVENVIWTRSISRLAHVRV